MHKQSFGCILLLDLCTMEEEPSDVKFTCIDDDTESEEELIEESEGKSLLKETILISDEIAPTSQSKEIADQRLSTLFCNWKFIIVVFLCIAYFLCNAAFSTIGPFFPKEVSHRLHSTVLASTFLVFIQGERKGASPAMVGIIIGSSPLCVVIVSPFVGYMVINLLVCSKFV